MQKDKIAFGSATPIRMDQQGRRSAPTKMGKVLTPRSSSPLSVHVDKLPCIIEQVFSTLAWDDLNECASVLNRDSDSLGSQVTESDEEFGDYALNFMGDSPATLESSLSPAELIPFQGCVIPPLDPQQDLWAEDELVDSSTETDRPPAHDGNPWREIAQCETRVLRGSWESQLHETAYQKQEETDSLQGRTLQLHQLASRAKHLSSVIEKLMTFRDPVIVCGDKTSLSPCKRQRLDQGSEAESFDSVEEILRDIRACCNDVLHSMAPAKSLQQDSDNIQMYGAFAGLHTSVSRDGTRRIDGGEAARNTSSFRTCVREHSTIRTQVFPHGHAFTSRTHNGGYCFRWLPNHS
ncbi:multicilin [Thalassophryne amazonica]|uniref:multicilin n=1 Tax=Thalassophryne amazonica TaxID=390379 RepID=UPI001470BA25|nr:multicilin [Thalassophryne amazonica]